MLIAAALAYIHDTKLLQPITSLTDGRIFRSGPMSRHTCRSEHN